MPAGHPAAALDRTSGARRACADRLSTLAAWCAAMLLVAGCADGDALSRETALASGPTGVAGPGLDRFDTIVSGIIHEFAIPGAGFALVHRGRLVMARGYGLADVWAGRPVEPMTPFLLASVSKAITATTVLKLVDDGRLRLDDRAFDILSDIPPPVDGIADPRTGEITVRDLLYHAGGWDRRTSGDPMTFGRRVARTLGVAQPIAPIDLARFMLGRPLDFAPGTRTVYSNYGYMLLGLIIERVTGREYSEYVRSATLEPMGIAGMVNGAGRRHYVAGQARRYDSTGQLDGAGGLPPTHFASGSWIGSAVEVARFMAAIGGGRPPRVLSPASWDMMLAPPPPPIPLRPDGGHFGMGWDVVERTPSGAQYHKDGLVTGATTWAEHDPAGVDWVLLLNANKGRPQGAELHREFPRRIRAGIASIGEWPDLDLFDRYR